MVSNGRALSGWLCVLCLRFFLPCLSLLVSVPSNTSLICTLLPIPYLHFALANDCASLHSTFTLILCAPCGQSFIALRLHLI